MLDISKAYCLLDGESNLISIFNTDKNAHTVDNQNNTYYHNEIDGKYYLTYEGKYLTDTLFVSSDNTDISYCATIHDWPLDTEITPISDFVFELKDTNAASTIYGNPLYIKNKQFSPK